MIRRSFWDRGEELINSGEKQKAAEGKGDRVEKRLGGGTKESPKGSWGRTQGDGVKYEKTG